MKKALIATLAAACTAAAAYGALGDVVGSFRVSNNCGGLAISLVFLYSNDYLPGAIYMCHSTTGSVYGSFNAVHAGYGRGLAYDGNYLWQNKCYSSPYLTYRTHASTGSIYASFLLPTSMTHGVAPLATGDYGAGTTALFHSDFAFYQIWIMNLSGRLIGSFAVPRGCQMYDIAYDWRNKLIWGALGGSGGSVPFWGLNTSGSIVATFRVNMLNSNGLTYAGQYLWAGTTAGWIYRIHCPGNVGVEPASLGKVKVLFR